MRVGKRTVSNAMVARVRIHIVLGLPLRVVVIALALLVSACAATSAPESVPVQTGASKGDAHAYDGQWEVKVRKHALLQYMPGNWQTRCHGEAFSFNALVSQSQFIVLAQGQGEVRVPVSASGKFNLRSPLDEPARGSAGSSLGRDQRTVILTGSLRTGRGRYTIGIAEFGDAGCTAKVDFERQS